MRGRGDAGAQERRGAGAQGGGDAVFWGLFKKPPNPQNFLAIIY